MKTELTDYRVYFIAGSQDISAHRNNRVTALLDLLDEALDAGIGCFQLREKGRDSLQDAEAKKQLAVACLQRCQAHGVPLLINDDVELALTIGADGVHVGQGDAPIADVIARCAGRLTVGLSINTLMQAKEANEIDGIDYFGVGPIFATSSKADAKAPVGTILIEAIRHAGVNKPIVGIGGISVDNAYAIRQAGANGVAVISAITQAKDIHAAVTALRCPALKS